MSNSSDYNNGYWFGKDSGYREGYKKGVRAERNRIKRAIEGNSGLSVGESSTLGSMVGGSIILTILGWSFVGLILFLFWVGGSSGEWWFPWIWRIAFWLGVGFIVVMSVAGIVMTIAEYREAKYPPEKSESEPKVPRSCMGDDNLWKKKNSIDDVDAVKEAETVNMADEQRD